jgi:flagellar basal body rod protein FlgB
VLEGALRRTNALHLQGSAANGPSIGRVFEDLSAGAGNDSNYVSLDREAAKVASNQLRYQVVTAIASSSLQGLSYAASDGKG